MIRFSTQVSFKKVLMRQEGFLLIAALTLMSALVLLGTTAFLLSSTDIKIGGNIKTSQMALQVAMAGTERAREILRQTNAASSDPSSFGDELLGVRGTNSVLNGYSASTDDVPVVPNPSTMNGVSYVVYLTNDPQDSGGMYSTTDTNKKAMLTAVATGPNNARAQVQTVVKVYSGATSKATIYSKGDVTGNGSSLTVSGNDACGQGMALAPIFTKDPATTDLSGHPTLSGSPSGAITGPDDIDIPGLLDSLKPSAATTLYEDTQNTTYGSSTNYTTVYSWPDDPDHYNVQGLTLSNITGYGILLVEGDLSLGGGFNWNGVIIATGSITLNGGGGPNAINIAGQVFSGTSTVTDITVNGSNVINYDSCKVKKAWAGAPLTVVNWKQSY
jgi:Tfp pilus assembly protein PilX